MLPHMDFSTAARFIAQRRFSIATASRLKSITMKQQEDFDSHEAALALQRILEDSRLAGHPVSANSSSATEATTTPAAAPDTIPSSSQPGSSQTPEEEAPEPSSAVCCAKEFKDW